MTLSLTGVSVPADPTPGGRTAEGADTSDAFLAALAALLGQPVVDLGAAGGAATPATGKGAGVAGVDGAGAGCVLGVPGAALPGAGVPAPGAAVPGAALPGAAVPGVGGPGALTDGAVPAGGPAGRPDAQAAVVPAGSAPTGSAMPATAVAADLTTGLPTGLPTGMVVPTGQSGSDRRADKLGRAAAGVLPVPAADRATTVTTPAAATPVLTPVPTPVPAPGADAAPVLAPLTSGTPAADAGAVPTVPAPVADGTAPGGLPADPAALGDVPDAAQTVDPALPPGSLLPPVAPTAAATPAPPVAPAAAPVPVASQVLAAMAPALQGPDGDWSVQLQLQPHDLGLVHVKVEVVDGQVSVAMHAVDPAAGDLLRDSLADLRDALEQQGLRTGGLDVGQGDLDRRQWQQGTPDTPSRSGGSGRGGGDGAALDSLPTPPRAGHLSSGLDVRL